MNPFEQEVARINGLTQEVHAMFPNTKFPAPSKQGLYFSRSDDTSLHTSIPDKVALVDLNTAHCYNIASKDYKLVLHEEVIHTTMQALKEMPEFGTPSMNLWLSDSGGKMRFVIEYTERPEVVRVDDLICPRIDIRGSYDLGWKQSVEFGCKRLICSNGMAVGHKFPGGYSNRHVSTLTIDAIVNTVRENMGKFSECTGIWKGWLEKKVNKAIYEGVFQSLTISDKEREKIEELPEIGNQLILPVALEKDELTVWDFNNILTQFANHEVQSIPRQVDLLKEIARAMDTLPVADLEKLKEQEKVKQANLN